jgi:16S rRNA (cytosine1402-N4)-methyltransferase
MGRTYEHHPVMLQPVLDGLNLKSGGVYVDGTFGRGGHSKAILEQLDANGRLLVMDKDPDAFEVASKLDAADTRVTACNASFIELEKVICELGWENSVDGILLDLGVSSPQLDDAERGFSFLRDGPLDMRMDTNTGQTAAEWLMTVAENELVIVLKTYGEERFARRIAREVVRVREEVPINTTLQLATLIDSAVPFKEKHKHPATRSFQAIRIYINRELEELKMILPQAIDALAPGGRLVVISFHSLEDRIVKRFMRDEQRGPVLPPDLPVMPAAYSPRLRIVGKPVRASSVEINDNPRARSAILRIAERAA